MSGGSLKLRGRVRAVLGDNIDTDMIYPGRYLNITDRELTAEHLFELAYPEMRAAIRPGDFLVAGRNFGCGSSREQAAAALKFAGVGAVIAGSFARIFFRNCHQPRPARGDRAGSRAGVRGRRRTRDRPGRGRNSQRDSGSRHRGRRSIRAPSN